MNTFRVAALFCVVALAGCQTVSVPDFGAQIAEFRNDLDDLDKQYMQAEELPGRPTEVRSAAEWDASAREMIALRDGLDIPPTEPALSDAAFEAAFREAQGYAERYKDDDPQ